LFPSLDLERELVIRHFYNDSSHTAHWYKPRDLNDVPEKNQVWASDTSVLCSYWPLSIIEELTLRVERYFYVGEYKPRYVFIGQDIKVMVLREGDEIHVTVCCLL
jgi:S-adenosylmethionine synthetase